MSNRKIIITKAALILLTSVSCFTLGASHASANTNRSAIIISELTHPQGTTNHNAKPKQVKASKPAKAKRVAHSDSKANSHRKVTKKSTRKRPHTTKPRHSKNGKKITHKAKVQKGKKVAHKSALKRGHKKAVLKKSNKIRRTHKTLKKKRQKPAKKDFKKRNKRRSQRVMRKKNKKTSKKELKKVRKGRPSRVKATKHRQAVSKRQKRMHHKSHISKAARNLARTVHKWIKNTRWPAMRLFMKLKNNTGQALSITPDGHYLFLNQTDYARNGWGHVVRINTRDHHVSYGPRVWFGHGQSSTYDSDNNMLVYLARTKNTVDDFAGRLAHHITVRFVNPWTLKETHHYKVNLHRQVLGDTLAYYDNGQFLNTRYKNHRHHTKMVNYLGSISNHRIKFHRIQGFVSANYRFNEGSAYNPIDGRLYTVYNRPNYLLSVNAQDLINGQVKPKQIYRSNLGHPELEPEGLAFDDNGYGYLSITNYDRQHPHDWIYKTKQPVNN